MARPLRIEFPGAMCHVMSRGNDRRAVVRDDMDRDDMDREKHIVRPMRQYRN